MKKSKRQEIAKAFKRAKALLANENEIEFGQVTVKGKHRWICYAIDWSTPTDHTSAERDAHEEAEYIVSTRLGQKAYLDGWVIENCRAAEELELSNRPQFQREMQAFRHRWLDALIEEFSK